MKKNIEENLAKILELDAPDKVKAQLQNLGLSEKEINNETAIAVALYQQAIKGNVNAINTIRNITQKDLKELEERQDRTEIAKNEIERISKLFSTMTVEQKELVKPLIENAGFMSATLDELRHEINTKGVKEKYKNGANQYGYKDSVEVKTYNAMIKNYMAIIKQLSDLLPSSNKNDLQDEFDRFCDDIE